MIKQHIQTSPFELKLADRIGKDGKIIPSRTVGFNTGAELCDYFERQSPVKPRRKRSKANIESRKKSSAAHKARLKKEGGDSGTI